MPHTRQASPLQGVRIVTVADDALPFLGKAFADLGADVQVLRPTSLTRRIVQDLLETRGKDISVQPSDPTRARHVLEQLLEGAHALVIDPRSTAAVGFDSIDDVRAAYPGLVIAALTEFGMTGPRASWIGTEPIYKAMSGTLSRSGEPGHKPLLQPGPLLSRGAAVELAWSILAAIYRTTADPSRDGMLLDCAVFEAGAVALDPAYGMTGSGTPDVVDARGRPEASHLYPIYKVSDGYVRVAALAKNQWLALLEWMGNPPELTDEELLLTGFRQENPDRVLPYTRAFFAPMKSAELVSECRARGIPASPVLSVAEVLDEPHFVESGVFADLGTFGGDPVRAPEGMARVDGVRTVPREGLDHSVGVPPETDLATGPYPLSGITVLDLGIIVAGAVSSELYAQLGARVIRIENTGFPDGMRRSFDQSWPNLARGHRGKESVGLDLRSEQGREIFLELVREADLVTSNFKPGTLQRLGLPYEEMAKVNPRIVCVESTAFGTDGPWRTAMGYGPLVRSGVGHSWLWRESADSDYFADGITIFPDHIVGRVMALTSLACLLERRRTGRGAHVTVAQCDVALVQINEALVTESLKPGSVQPPGDMGVHLIRDILLPAAGDDSWCVVDPRTPEHLDALRRLLGVDPEGDVDTALAEWLATHEVCEASRMLQEAGVPAGPLFRVAELKDDAGLQARDLYELTDVSGTDEQVLVEKPPVRGEGFQTPELAPFPMFGVHTRSVLSELGKSDAEIDALFDSGVAQRWDLVDS